jgi:hypothetical protein
MNSKRSRPPQEPASTSPAGYGEMPRPMSGEERDYAATIGTDVRQTARSAGSAIREQKPLAVRYHFQLLSVKVD